MSLLVNKIGDNTFIRLDGKQHPPAQTKVLDDRMGIDGQEFLLTGKKGKPFVLTSHVDAESYENAKSYILDYQDLIDGDAVQVVQAGTSSDTFGYRCVVLDVEEVACYPIRGAIGNALSPPSLGFVIAQWTLIAVPN